MGGIDYGIRRILSAGFLLPINCARKIQEFVSGKVRSEK